MCKFENFLRVVPSFVLFCFPICLNAINKPSSGKILMTSPVPPVSLPHSETLRLGPTGSYYAQPAASCLLLTGTKVASTTQELRIGEPPPYSTAKIQIMVLLNR